VLCFALFASAFNLLLGYAGLLSFGHAAFFGAAAYFAGYALHDLGWPTAAGLLLGVGAAALLGLIIGGLAIRRSGIYFSMITLALAQMLYFVFLQAPFTHGEDGLQGIPRGSLLGLVSLDSDLTLYFVVLAFFVGSYLFIQRVVRSPFGQLLSAVRDNEARAISLGYAPARAKLLAFVLSATLAGLAGALKALVLGFASLTDAHWSTSGLVILMVLVGGVGSLLAARRSADHRWPGEQDWRYRYGPGRDDRHFVVFGLGRRGYDSHGLYFCSVRHGLPTRGHRRVDGVVAKAPRRFVGLRIGNLLALKPNLVIVGTRYCGDRYVVR